jgi:signal peptidase I
MDDPRLNDPMQDEQCAACEALTPPQPDSASPVAAELPDKLRAEWNVLPHLQFSMLALTIALFIITFVVQAFRIPSGSMEDTLLVGDYLLVDKTRFAPSGLWGLVLPYRPIQRGDIIVFRYPADPTQHFVKRVIGLPGDHIHLWRSRVYINGQPLNEPYVVYKEHFADEFRDNFPRGSFNENVTVEWGRSLREHLQNGELVIPPGKYFAMGDNRDESLDSRYWGFVPRDNIIGRPMLIYFSTVQDADDDDESVAADRPDDKLFTLHTRISHWMGDLRWRRILRLAP